jgi:hypothetical protein
MGIPLIRLKLGRLALAAAMASSLVGSAAPQSATSTRQADTPPKDCRPCLFYGGDFDFNNSAANGLLDEIAASRDGEVYVPFRVPTGHEWQVTGLLVHLISLTIVTPARVHWEIRTGVSTGHRGTLVASGKGRAIFGGRFNCGTIEFFCQSVVVRGINSALQSGRYWLSVVPECAGSGGCGNAEFFLADVEDNPPPNHYGPIEPWDDSFFTSKTLGAYFQPSWGSSGACGGIGCDRFSAGVLGTKKQL